MSDDTEKRVCKCKGHHGDSSEAIYCLGLMGAAIYYLQHAKSFMEGVFGIIKAVGWPAVVLYKVLELLKL
jgi:hypothetical protein